MNQKSIFTSTFTFSKKQFDDEFHLLDEAIAKAAKSIPGYLGEETWENADTDQVSNVYYWDTLEALRTLIDNPIHIQAKRKSAQWLKSYHVVIAQVIRAYGDGDLSHPLKKFHRGPRMIVSLYTDSPLFELGMRHQYSCGPQRCGLFRFSS